MEYQYEITDIRPKQEFMVVVYRSEGYPDYTRTLNPKAFDDQSIADVVSFGAQRVVDFWARWKDHPESANVSVTGSGSAEPTVVRTDLNPQSAPVIAEAPEFDHFTQRIELNQIEDPTQPTVEWSVIDMTADEQAAYLAQWRSLFGVSMAQFRQALYERGIIEAAMSMSAKDINSQILWETSDFVPRHSERVKAAMGMTDEELDEFFIYASTMEMTL